MKVVLDSNVLIAAFAARGVCAELLEHCVRQHEPVSSPFILDEVRSKLVEKIGISGPQADEAVRLIRARFPIVEPVPLPTRVSRDPDDDTILATGVAGHCDVIVTGDRDLLDLEAHEGIRIVSPRDFWKHEAGRRTEE